MTKPVKIRSAQTLKSVAKLAGVSEMTVSRVLSGKGSYSEKSRAKVEAAVGTSGYLPNRIAGSLASSRSTQVAVIVPTIGNIVFTEVLAGISAELSPAGLQAVLGVTEYDLNREEALVETLLSWRPQALIIAGLEHTPGTVRRLKGAGIPVVQIMDIDGDVIDTAVGFSQTEAGPPSPGIFWQGATGASRSPAPIFRSTRARENALPDLPASCATPEPRSPPTIAHLCPLRSKAARKRSKPCFNPIQTLMRSISQMMTWRWAPCSFANAKKSACLNSWPSPVSMGLALARLFQSD